MKFGVEALGLHQYSLVSTIHPCSVLKCILIFYAVNFIDEKKRATKIDVDQLVGH